MLLFAAILAALTSVSLPWLAGRGLLLAMTALYAASLLAVLIALLPMGRMALPALALRGAGWKPVVLGSLGTVALSVAVSEIGPELEGMKQIAELVRTPEAVVASVLVLGGLAPLAEELAFRGLLYGWIEGRWGVRPAFTVSAIAFAAAHFDPTFAYMVAVLPLALLFSWLRWRTNSLLPSLVAHIVNNTFAVLSAAWLGS